MRSGPWKLHIKQSEVIDYWKPTLPLDTPELYHLEHDIGEQYDLASAYPDRVAEMLELLEAHREKLGEVLPDNLAARIPETSDPNNP